MEWPYHSFDCVLLYWIVQLDFKILLKEFGTDCLGLVFFNFIITGVLTRSDSFQKFGQSMILDLHTHNNCLTYTKVTSVCPKQDVGSGLLGKCPKESFFSRDDFPQLPFLVLQIQLDFPPCWLVIDV